MTLKRRGQNTVTLFLYLILINISWSQGTSCSDPIDLNPFIPVTGNETYHLDVDNTSSGQFFTYTATQEGKIEMSSAYSNVKGDGSFDSWLRVYDSNCNLIFDQDDTPGLYGGVEFSTNVAIGDTYIFEWANHEWAGAFTVEFIYHVPVTGETCNDPVNLVLGSNTVDTWIGDQYYTYTATENGVLELSTCGLWNSGGSNIELLDGCNGSVIGVSSDECDYNTEGWESVTYQITDGETVIIQMKEAQHKHYDYTFNATFNVNNNTCATAIEINTMGVYEVDHTYGDQWYKFTAPKDGAAVVTTGISSMANSTNFLNQVLNGGTPKRKDTKIEIYELCDGEVWKSNSDFPGLFGASEISQIYHDLNFKKDHEYLIHLVDAPNGFENEKGDIYKFELFYLEDLIIGTDQNPLNVIIGSNEEYANLYYAEEQWFEYEFTSNSLFSIVLSTYYDGSSTVITTESAVDWTYPDDDSGADGFKINGVIGDVVKFKFSGKNRNNTFTASITESVLSIGSESNETISMYPNPVKDLLNIKGLEMSNLNKIVLFDLTGRNIPIHCIRTAQNSIEINLNKLAKGTYLLQINNNSKMIIKE